MALVFLIEWTFRVFEALSMCQALSTVCMSSCVGLISPYGVVESQKWGRQVGISEPPYLLTCPLNQDLTLVENGMVIASGRGSVQMEML